MEAHVINNSSFHIRVDGAGRVVIPVSLRSRHGILPGQEVFVEEQEDGIRIRTMDEVIRDVQSRCRKYAEPNILQSEELIRERREEAAMEASEEVRARE